MSRLTLLLVLCTLAEFCNSAEKIRELPLTDTDREHWSFLPLSKPRLPNTENRSWSRDPIDSFILARLDAEQLKPSPVAERIRLLRRLSFDLIGLPPDTDEVMAFSQDDSPDAYERLVDRLLASPSHGEHWAQYWLDLARYAETDGFEHDKVRPQAWKYRDWIIDALNADMPYDRFVALQLAGDELEPGSESAKVATAFCLSGPDMPDINSMDERKHNVLNEMTSTVSATLLGLQIGCAQCHEHKYDPISQHDFYRMRAIFEPAIQLKKNQSVSVLMERAGKPAPSFLMIRGNWQRQGPEVSPAPPRIASPEVVSFEIEKRNGNSSGRRAALARWVTQPTNMLTTRVMANRLWQYHFGKGLSQSPSDFGLMGDEPSHPELLDWLAGDLVHARWSLKRMHRRIVGSSTFRQASDVSRQASDVSRQASEAAIQHDQKNNLYAWYPRRRLTGESVRDAILSATGVLNARQGGPGVRPPLPAELKTTLLRGQWEETRARSEHDRRSVYIFARRNLRFPIFEAFDRPDANVSCAHRSQSTTAPQSLLMLNSQFSLNSAQRLAGFVISQAGEEAEKWISLAFLRALSRPPTNSELEDALNFLDSQSQTLIKEKRSIDSLARPTSLDAALSPYNAAALVDFCLALINCNEFIYVD